METQRVLVHTSRLTLRWGDLDAFGHLNNVHYFRLMEECRVQWLIGLGIFPAAAERGPTARLDSGPVVAQLNCSFKQAVHYPATLQVLLFIGRLGRSSLETWHEIRSEDGGTLYAEGGATVVWVNAASGRPVPFPEQIRKAI